jgi:arabinofuranosyltransferase
MSELKPISVRPWHHLTLGLALAVIHMLFYLGWSMDDPHITFRYVESVAGGEGFVFNPGEAPVEGYSNFLWLLLLLPCRLLLGPDSLMPCAQILGVLCALATGPLLALAWQRTGPPAKDAGPLWRWLPLHLWALSGPAMLWAVGGLETPLVALLVTCALWGLGERWDADPRRAPLLALVFALLALSRPEGAMFGLAFFAVTVWGLRRKGTGQIRAWLLALGLFVLALVLYTAWRWWIFGSLLPNTYCAKMGGSLLPRLGRGVAHLGDLILLTGGLPVLAWLGLWAWRRGAAVRAAALFAVLQILFLVWVGGDWMPAGRFLVPAIPCLLLLGTAGLRRSWDGVCSVTEKRGIRDLLILVLLVWLGFSLFGERQATRELVRLLRSGELHGPLIEAAIWIEQHAEPDDTFAGEEAGIIPYLTERRFLDLLGIVDAHLARQPGAMHSKMDVDYVVNQWRPDWVLILSTPDVEGEPIHWHSPATAILVGSEPFQSHYTEVHQIPRLWGTQVTRVFQLSG